MPIALGALAMGEETLRGNEMQIVLSPCHGDVEQAAFFVDLVLRADAEVDRDAAIDDVENEHRLPFLALGRMDRRQDQVILVEMRNASLVTRCIQWIKGELGQEAFTRGIARRDLPKLQYESVSTTRRELPAWLDSVLRQALHPQPARRHEALSAFVHDLRHPAAHHLRAQRMPLIERDPVRFWRGLALVLGMVVVALVGALARGG